MKGKWSAVVVFFVVAFTGGVLRQIYTPVDRITKLDLVVLLIGAVCIFSWFRYDSDERKYHRSPVLSMMVILLTIVAMPYYLFRTRGFAKGLLGTTTFLVCGIAFEFVGYGGEWAAYLAQTH